MSAHDSIDQQIDVGGLFLGCFGVGKPTIQDNYSTAAAFAEFLPNIHCVCTVCPVVLCRQLLPLVRRHD